MIGYTQKGQVIQRELSALEEVKQLLEEEAVSLREASDYLSYMYDIQISHVGLRKRIINGIYKD